MADSPWIRWKHPSVLRGLLRSQSHSHGTRARSVWPAMEGILVV